MKIAYYPDTDSMYIDLSLKESVFQRFHFKMEQTTFVLDIQIRSVNVV